MRTFSLVNKSNNSISYDITTKAALFSGVSGLGFSVSENYRQVGNRWIVTNRKPKQQNITGSLIFADEQPYLQYWQFMQFLSKGALVLNYRPNDQIDPTVNATGVTYQRDVTITNVTKTELELEHYLNCNLTIVPLTPWYKHVVISNGQIAKPLKWGSFEDLGAIKWGIEWGEFNEWERGIASDSTSDSPSRLTIYGPITNPRWTHYVNGIEYETGKVNATIQENEYLLVDNTVDPYVIEKRSAVNDGFITDLYELGDFTTKRFISLQNGINTVHVAGDNAIDPITKLEGYLYYESV